MPVMSTIVTKTIAKGVLFARPWNHIWLNIASILIVNVFIFIVVLGQFGAVAVHIFGAVGGFGTFGCHRSATFAYPKCGNRLTLDVLLLQDIQIHHGQVVILLQLATKPQPENICHSIFRFGGKEGIYVWIDNTEYKAAAGQNTLCTAISYSAYHTMNI